METSATQEVTGASTLSLPIIFRKGLRLLQEALRICSHASSGTSDTVLVAVDFEQTDNFRHGLLHSQDYQAGVTVLDTRRVAHPNKNHVDSSQHTTGPADLRDRPRKTREGISSGIQQLSSQRTSLRVPSRSVHKIVTYSS